MTATWPSDPGGEKLVLVGPIMRWSLTDAQLDERGLVDAPQIAVDGGLRYANKMFMWTGDGDSSSRPADVPAAVKESQSETDLRYCLNGIRPWDWRELHLFGFTGARHDHEFANFGEIHAEIAHRLKFRTAVFYDAEFRTAAVFYRAGLHTFHHQGRFSALAFAPAKISLSGGCTYKAKDLQLAGLSGAGISNEAQGEVILACDAPVAIFYPHD